MDVPCTDACTFILSAGQCDAGVGAWGALGQREQSCGCERKAVQLKGVSTHGIAWFPEYINKQAFKSLRDDWGANAVRLALYTEEYGGYCSGGSKSQLKEKIQEGDPGGN